MGLNIIKDASEVSRNTPKLILDRFWDIHLLTKMCNGLPQPGETANGSRPQREMGQCKKSQFV